MRVTGEQWRQVYVLKQRKPPSLAQLAGRADHKAIETSMAQKITSGVDLPVAEVAGVFLADLESEVNEVGLTEMEGAPTIAEYDSLRSEGQNVVSGYHRLVSPTVQPVAVEEEVRIAVPGLPVEVVGRIDLVEKHQIIDRKRSKSNRKPKGDWILQAGIYQLARPLPYRWHVSVTTKVPQFVTDNELDAPADGGNVTQRQLRDACVKLGFLYQRYGPDEPWPATGKQHDWACNYCGFRNDCWAWK